jgi:hypothetical protein
MIHTLKALSVAGTLLINAASSLAGTVNVSFIHPENFADASLQGGYGKSSEQATLEQLGHFLESLGPWYLKAGQTLALDVLNVDLAGRIEWWRRDFYDTRILRDVYPPRFTLKYRLVEAGQVLVESQETVVDPDYLANPGIYFSTSDPLRFEKAMLEDWFRRRFGDHRSAATLR